MVHRVEDILMHRVNDEPLALAELLQHVNEFREADVECIRVGLCASDNLGDGEQVVGGANHPALGELVEGELYFDEMCRQLDDVDLSNTDEACFAVPRGDLSKAIGQGGRNRARLQKKYGIKKIRFEEDPALEGYPALMRK